ncbi:MAG: hypothetical protein JWL79_1331 [Frankiales bacterium]|nr:hypothetical protein [Frankiales bacterium]
MKAAVLNNLGTVPAYADFEEPIAADGQTVVAVTAAAVNHFTLLVCSGTFYSTPPALPFVPGSDGIGRTQDGTRVFFDMTVAPYGAWAQHTLVPTDALLSLDPNVTDAAAAAVGNSGLAAWTALTWRAQLEPGETVVVLGATGALGYIATQAARALGAGRVVAVDLDGPRLQAMSREAMADVVVPIEGDDLAGRLLAATDGGADITIDALWGAPGLAALQAARQGCRHIQMGHMAGLEVDLSATVLRSRGVDLRGYALFQCPQPLRQAAYLDLTGRIARGDIQVDYETVPLRDVGEAWERQSHGANTKLVLVP